MGVSGRATETGVRNTIMWLRDRGFSISEISRRAGVHRETARKIIGEEMESREISKNPSGQNQDSETDGE